MAKQDGNDKQSFLLNPILIKTPFSQSIRTTIPPNFRPIPFPEALRPNKNKRLPSEIEFQFSTTTQPTQFETNFGLQLPSQLANLLGRSQNPVELSAVKSESKSSSQLTVRPAFGMFSDYEDSNKLDDQYEKKRTALEVFMVAN